MSDCAYCHGTRITPGGPCPVCRIRVRVSFRVAEGPLALEDVMNGKGRVLCERCYHEWQTQVDWKTAEFAVTATPPAPCAVCGQID